MRSRAFGIPFVHVPVTRETKPEAERRQAELLAGNFDLIVLARYMQILSAGFLQAVDIPIINIHHSFLPAFAGAEPYRARARARGQAHRRDGALRHRAARRGSDHRAGRRPRLHRHSAEDLERQGADVERIVLARAVQWHCEDRVVRDGDRTVVF